MEDDAELERGSLQLVGIAVTEDGQPVEGARVSLDSERFATSDRDGRFVFAELEAGLYRLRARKDDLCAEVTLVTLHEKRAPVLLALAPGMTLVIDISADASPVAGARVMAEKEAVAISDASGRAVVRGVGSRFQMFEIRADGYAPALVSMSLAPDPGATLERKVMLERGAALGGVVVDAEGAPVGGATVWAFGGSWSGEVTSDAHGAWRFDAVVRGAYEIRASSKRHASMPVVVEHDGKTACTDVVVRVQRGGRIAGRVIDATGAPVVRPVVVALVPNDERRDERVVRGGEDGRFEMVLEPASYDVFAHDVHRASPVSRVEVADGNECQVELVVEDTAIAGVVVDSRGNAVVGAEVGADAAVTCVDLTDELGRFFLGALPPDEYAVEALRRGQHETACGGDPGVQVVAGDKNARLVLTPLGRITGRVLFEGNPLRHFGVLLTRTPQWPWMGQPFGVRTEDGHFVLDGMAPGTWGVVFAGRGTSRHTIDKLDVEADATVDLGDIELSRGQRITGVVRDAAGAAVAGARVVIGRSGLEDQQIDPLQQWFHSEFQTTTAADGSFIFDGVTSLRPPNARPTPISAMHPVRGASVCVALPEGDATVELTLVETGSIEGVIEPFPGGFASVAAHRKDEPADLRRARVSPTGTFTLEGIPPGEYAIVMTARPRHPVAPPVTTTVVANQRASVRLVMPATTAR